MDKKFVVDYNTFVKEEVQNDQDGKDIKLFYTVETKRIQIPVGGEDAKDKYSNKKLQFDKIFKRISKISKFIKLPTPILKLIETKKYYTLFNYKQNGISFYNGLFSNGLNYTDNFSEVQKEQERLRKEASEEKEKKGFKEESTFEHLYKIVSKDVEIYDLTMATVIKPDDEWVILGTIDYKDNLLKAAPGQQVPLELVGNLSGRSQCDHCHKEIYRNKIVFVKNLSNDKILKVGGSCIKNYLGYDYEKVLSYLTDISFLDVNWGGEDGDSGDWDEEGGGWGGGRQEPEVPVDEIVKYFAWWYKNRGYISKAGAEKINSEKTEGKEVIPTSAQVSGDVDYVNSRPSAKEYDTWSRFCEDFYKKIETVDNVEVQLVYDFIENNYKDSNFLFNSYNMIKAGVVKKNLIYYISGACSFYFGKLKSEEMRKQAEMGKPDQKPSEWVGNIGEKTKLSNLEIVHIGGFTSNYGWTDIYKLKDQEGNIFTKFGVVGTQFVVKKTEKEPDNTMIQVGDVVSFTAEIKDHNEYNGTKQTVLGRFSKF
jgi:hypothetical protein